MKPNLRQLFFEHVGQTSDFPMGLEVERAEGVWLLGPNGKKWIDLISGVSVSNVGHNNPAVVEAVCSQARDYLHLMVYGEVIQSPQVRYAARIAELLPPRLQSVYFVNSGSEAVEGALKLAKRYTGRTELVSFKNAYHGSTHGSLSVMGGEEYRNSYRPLLPDVRQLRFNRPEDLEQITARTACVIVEPVLGHITTFGGHPVCCAAGLAALEYLLGEGLMQQADAKGARYEQAMRAHPAVKEVRRAGLLMAVEFGDAALCERVVQRAVETGLLTEWFLFWPTALRIAPPLTITDDEIDASCRILLDAIDHAVARAGGR